MRLTARELYERAVSHANAGRHAAARRDLSAARAREPGDDLIARIAGTEAAIRVRNGESAAAEALCRDALAMPGISTGTKAVLEGQLGLLALENGRIPDAIELLTSAIALVGDDRDHRSTMLLNRSVAYMHSGRLADARADLERAVSDFASVGNVVSEAMALHNAGYVALLEGDLVPALQHMTRARPAILAASGVNTAISDLDRAEVLRDAGLTREAEDVLEKVAGVFGANRMPRARAEAEFNLALSLLSHDPERARRVARSAARRFGALGNEMWALRARGVGLRADLGGGRLVRGGRADEPRRVPGPQEIEETADALDGHGLHNEAAALRLSRELWAIRHGLPVVEQPRRPARSASLEVRVLSHEVRAERAVARGRDAEARRHAARGLDVLGDWQRGFGSLDLQTSIALHGSDLIFTGLQAAVRTGRPDIVFEWSERARHLSQRVVTVRPPPDREVAEALAELRMLRADGPAWLESTRSSELRHSVRERQWSSTGSSDVEDHATLDEVRAALGSDTALVTFVYSGLGLAALVVTSTGARVVAVEAWGRAQRALTGLRADLDVWASVRAGGLAEVVRRSLDARLAALSAALLDAPLALVGDASRIVLTVPGVLNGIPWAMLPALRRHPFTVAVSATRWARAGARTAHRPASAGFVAGPRIPRGEEEIEVGSASWSAPRTLRPAEATVGAVTALAAGVDLLHVAAHGRHAGDNPMFSGLELADGTLFGYDIDLIPDVPQTVVLSACEVGRSSVRWGEEAIGMTRIWLHAGTRCVIASPVVVADDDACELLGAMHDGLARGVAPAVALAEASARTGIVAPFQAHGSGF